MKIQISISEVLGSNNLQSDVSENNDALLFGNFLPVLVSLTTDVLPDNAQWSLSLKPVSSEELLSTPVTSGPALTLQSIDTDPSIAVTENMIMMREGQRSPKDNDAQASEAVTSPSLPLMFAYSRSVGEVTTPSPAPDNTVPLVTHPAQKGLKLPIQTGLEALDIAENETLTRLAQTIKSVPRDEPCELNGVEALPCFRTTTNDREETVPKTDEFMPLTDTVDKMKATQESWEQYDLVLKTAKAEIGKTDHSLQTPALTDHQPLESVAKTSQPFENVISNITDFLNNKIMLSETLSQKNPLKNESSDEEIFSTMPNKRDLSSVSFNTSDLLAIKMDKYSAKITVHPAELGQITADIVINKGKTELTLQADNPLVKHFIETHLLHLRETFQSSNIQLSHVTVQNNQTSDKHPSGRQQNALFDGAAYPLDDHSDHSPLPIKRPPSDLIIDTYA